MVGKEHIPIDRNINLDKINVLIRHENNSRMLKRLYFVKFRFLGDSVEEAATKVGVTKSLSEKWLPAITFMICNTQNRNGYSDIIDLL